ncbi:hypothetical protein B6264_30570 (plasmid) [Kitasatospora aureofaciens]|nr:hypothetical protein B6264_30570 [Kitasatospora aureofaciens]
MAAIVSRRLEIVAMPCPAVPIALTTLLAAGSYFFAKLWAIVSSPAIPAEEARSPATPEAML